MQLIQILKAGVGGGAMSPVNEIIVDKMYPTKEQILADKAQAILALKNLLLVYGRLFKNVDQYAAVESIQAIGGVSYADKVAAHIVTHTLSFEQIEATFSALRASGKVALNDRKSQIALDILCSAINQRSGASFTSSR